jgi:hypothetical protein
MYYRYTTRTNLVFQVLRENNRNWSVMVRVYSTRNCRLSNNRSTSRKYVGHNFKILVRLWLLLECAGALFRYTCMLDLTSLWRRVLLDWLGFFGIMIGVLFNLSIICSRGEIKFHFHAEDFDNWRMKFPDLRIRLTKPRLTL